LLAVARGWVGSDRAFDGSELTGPGWSQLLAAAEGERAEPFLHAAVRQARVPTLMADRLRRAWIVSSRRHLLGVANLRRLLAAFGDAAIPVIPLKGPALGDALYGDPSLRPFTDLDLLVRRADVERAVALLANIGYRHIARDRTFTHELAHATAACFVPADTGSGDFPVDLHWGLVSFPAGATPRTIDAEEVWTRAVATERWELPLLELCREDLLLYLALHLAVHHPFVGFVWRLDLALLLRRTEHHVDWAMIVERARRWRVRGALYYALRLVQEHLVVGPPSSVLAELRPHGVRGEALERLACHRDQMARFDHLVDLLLLDAGADLLRAIATSVVPTPGFVRGRYGTSSAVRAYLAHYRRIGAIGIRAAQAIAGRH
jgi:hypothetical protein